MLQSVSNNNSNAAANAAVTVRPVALPWSTEQIETIKRTVAVDATPSELQMFLHLAAKYDLDPLAREIWFIKTGRRNVIMTGRDGYLKIAHASPMFSGLYSDVVYERDTFTKNEAGIEHNYSGGNRGAIIGAYAIVYRKDWVKPAFFYAPMRDYDKKSGCWLQYPHAMILKVAEAMALKRAFSISGLITAEEVTPNGEITRLEMAKGYADPAMTEAQFQFSRQRRASIWRNFCTLFNGDAELAEAEIKRLVGDKPSVEWSDSEMKKLEYYIVKALQAQVDPPMAHQETYDVNYSSAKVEPEPDNDNLN